MKMAKAFLYGVNKKCKLDENIELAILLTQTEYDALATKDNDVYYIIIEEEQ